MRAWSPSPPPGSVGAAGVDLLSGVVDDLTDVVDAQVRVTVPVIATPSPECSRRS